MSTSALDRLFGRGNSHFEINSHTKRISIGDGPKDQPARFEIVLKVTPLAAASWMADLALNVRLIGPAQSFDRTEHDELIVGIVSFPEDACDIGIAGNSEFIMHASQALLNRDSRKILTITTSTKLEPGTRENILILGAEIQIL